MSQVRGGGGRLKRGRKIKSKTDEWRVNKDREERKNGVKRREK